MNTVTLVNMVPPLKGDTTVPLGPLYIAAVLEETGCSVDFRDYQLTSYKNPLHKKSISDFLSPAEDVLAIGCFFNVLPFLLPPLQKLKDENPDKTIILGGPGPSSVAEPLMEAFPFVDVIVKGEGESTVAELAQGVPYRNIKGIVYQSDGKVVTNPERERIRHLDALPFPAYSAIDVSQYDHVGVITARGCPYRCTFCEVAPLWGHYTAERSVPNVIKEIKLLHNKGVTRIHLNDDTFVLNRQWVAQFCDALRTENLDITWMCNGRINLMDEPLISKMAHSGCTAVQYGIESGSERVLKMMGKQINVAQIKKVVNLSVQHMDTITTFMWGFPFETMDDFFQTVYTMGVLADMGAVLSLFLLAPLPLSQLYREYADQLRFSAEIVSPLAGDMINQIPPEEKNNIIEMILTYPHIFSGFYHIYTPDIYKKHAFLKQAGLIR